MPPAYDFPLRHRADGLRPLSGGSFGVVKRRHRGGAIGSSITRPYDGDEAGGGWGAVGYETLGTMHSEGFRRAAFWLAMLNGAAGHTYGANGTWEVLQCGQTPAPHEVV